VVRDSRGERIVGLHFLESPAQKRAHSANSVA